MILITRTFIILMVSCMNIQETIDVIIEQERKEIKYYNVFALVVIIGFFTLLCFNLITGYIKDVPAALTNFLTLSVGYIPIQQIVKRRKKINYFDKIVRFGADENQPDKTEYINMVKTAIETGIKA